MFLLELDGWNKAVFDCIRGLGKNEFDLKELYVFQPELKKKYPNNNFIEQKIQQEMFWRKAGVAVRICN